MYISIFLRTRGSERGSKLPKITLVLAEWYEVQLQFSRLLSLQLVKTAELDPSQNYFTAYHPHGIMGIGTVTNLCTEGTGFSLIFPGIRPHLMTLNMFFQVLLVRDYIMLGGKSFNHWIAQVYEGWRHEGGF